MPTHCQLSAVKQDMLFHRVIALERSGSQHFLYLLWKGKQVGMFLEKPFQARFSVTVLNQLNPLRSIVKKSCHEFGPVTRRAVIKDFVGLASLNASTGYLVRDTARIKLCVRVDLPKNSEVSSKRPEAVPPYTIGGVDQNSFNDQEYGAPLYNELSAPLYLLYNINAFREVPSKTHK